jgi:hypothetical protein
LALAQAAIFEPDRVEADQAQACPYARSHHIAATVCLNMREGLARMRMAETIPVKVAQVALLYGRAYGHWEAGAVEQIDLPDANGPTRRVFLSHGGRSREVADRHLADGRRGLERTRDDVDGAAEGSLERQVRGAISKEVGTTGRQAQIRARRRNPRGASIVQERL